MPAAEHPSLREIGFVVIGRNEGDRLEACLRALDPGANPVIYVDSGSTDGSPETARNMGARVVDLSADAPFTAARGRTEGFDILVDVCPDVRYVQFVDGDCILVADWLPAAIGFLEKHPDVAGVCGRRFEASPAGSTYNELIDREWNTTVGEADACGGDSLMRVAALRQVGGFDPHLRAGEEPELCSRLRQAGWRIWRLDLRMTEHDAKITRFGQWWKRAIRSGYGYAQVWARTRKHDRPLYAKNLRSAVVWGAAIPLICIAAAIMSRSWLVLGALPVTYALQITRIALRQSAADTLRWKAASLIVVTKFAEFIGAVQGWARAESRQVTSYR